MFAFFLKKDNGLFFLMQQSTYNVKFTILAVFFFFLFGSHGS
jgi:hypothetical protein